MLYTEGDVGIKWTLLGIERFLYLSKLCKQYNVDEAY